MAAMMLIPAFVLAIVMASAAAPVVPATIIILVAVAIVSMVSVIPVASSIMVSGIPILVAELECIPIILADACQPSRRKQRGVVTIWAACEIISPPRPKALIIRLVV